MNPFLAIAFSAWLGFNTVVLDQVEQMPAGGGYRATAAQVKEFENSVRSEIIRPDMPSFCSGATYLVFLKAVQVSGVKLDPDIFMVHGQADGEGVWGRWNANGPGTARLFYETGAGVNFTEWEDARPGDFMKIWWTDEVGSLEHGHSVVVIKITPTDLTFWSSNIPGGYGKKTIPRTKVAHAIFSRLLYPDKLGTPLPAMDLYLSSLLYWRSSFAEACEKSGIK